MPTSTTWTTVYLPAATMTITPLPAAAGIPTHWAATSTFPPGVVVFAIFSLALTAITIAGYMRHDRRITQPSITAPTPSINKAGAPDSIPLNPYPAPAPDRHTSARSRIREPQSIVISLPDNTAHEYAGSEWGSIPSPSPYSDGIEVRPGPARTINTRRVEPPNPMPADSSVYSDYDRLRRTSSLPPMPAPPRVRSTGVRAGGSEVEGLEGQGVYGGSSVAASGSRVPVSMAPTVQSTWNLGFGSMPRDRASKVSVPTLPGESEFGDGTILTGDPY